MPANMMKDSMSTAEDIGMFNAGLTHAATPEMRTELSLRQIAEELIRMRGEMRSTNSTLAEIAKSLKGGR